MKIINPLLYPSKGVGKFDFPEEGTPTPSYCSAMTLADTPISNSSAAINGMSATVTNTGGGAGVMVISATPTVTSATGKLSVEIKIDSVTDDTSGSFDISIIQGVTPVIQLRYQYNTGNLVDINSNVLANFTYVAGETVLGLTIDQENETATYSYKVDDETAATANASLPVSGYDNATTTIIGSFVSTETSAVAAITLNSGTAAFSTNVDGQGYCAF